MNPTYLPDLDFIADSMSDFFGPEDCRENYVVRSGQIKTVDGEILKATFGAYCPEGKISDFSFLCFNENDQKWELRTGYSSDKMKEVLFPVINTKDW